MNENKHNIEKQYHDPDPFAIISITLTSLTFVTTLYQVVSDKLEKMEEFRASRELTNRNYKAIKNVLREGNMSLLDFKLNNKLIESLLERVNRRKNDEDIFEKSCLPGRVTLYMHDYERNKYIELFNKNLKIIGDFHLAIMNLSDYIEVHNLPHEIIINLRNRLTQVGERVYSVGEETMTIGDYLDSTNYVIDKLSEIFEITEYEIAQYNDRY